MKFFCCSFRPAGISDQLFQLRIMYDLGRRLGLEYLYQPLEVNPASVDFDFAEFLGLGFEERTVDQHPDLRRNRRSAREVADAVASGAGLAPLGLAEAPDSEMLEIAFDRSFYRTPHKSLPRVHEFDLRSRFWRKAMIESPEYIRPLSDSGLVVCVHIRLGDLTLVEHRGKYVFLALPQLLRSRRHPHLQRVVPIARYRELLCEILRCHGERIAEIRVFSDGPTGGRRPRCGTLSALATRTFIAVGDGRLPASLAWLYDPLSVKEISDGYERLQAELTGLSDLQRTRLFIGTTPALTREAIANFARADIVIQPRRGPGFPGLGLADPERQVVLSMEDESWDSLKILAAWLVGRSSSSTPGAG